MLRVYIDLELIVYSRLFVYGYVTEPPQSFAIIMFIVLYFYSSNVKIKQ